MAGTAQTQCLTGADGRFSASRQAILGLKLRHAFAADVGAFSTLAFAPRFSIDVESDAWSVDVPLYFAGDGANKLRDGIRAVYLS